MNKLYISALALSLIGGTAMAQSNGSAHNRVLKQRITAQPAHHVPVGYSANREVIWTDDFSNPATWNIGNINDPNNDNWVIGTTGSTGPYTIGTIESTTAANGFALFDSDLLCGGLQNAWIAMANPIDLSAYSGVVLQFEQFYREFQGTCYVETSIDNGATWTTTQINDIGGNSITDNPELLSVNLSSQIGGAASALIRFRYEGGCDYAWMIDDVAVITLPDHEIIMDYGYTAQFGGGYEYGRVPQSQMPSTLDVGAGVINFGANDQTNVSVSISLMDESMTEIGSAIVPIGTMLNGDTSVAEANITLPSPTPVGIYTAYFTVTSDQIGMDDNMSNNFAYRYFQVSNDLYTLDGIDMVPDSILSLSQAGTGSFTDNTQDVRLLNYFEIQTGEMFYGGEIVLSSNTDAGSYFTMSVYDTADVLASTPDLSSPLAQSDIRVISQTDLDNGGVVGLSFLDPIMLNPGAYFVSANMFQESGNDLFILDDETVPQPSIASMLWIPVDDQNINLYGGNGTAWAVRLSKMLGVGVQEAPALQGVTMYPSPTTGPVQIRSEITGHMTVEVYNTLGTLVQTASFNGTETSLDLSGNAAGIYTIRVGDGTNYNVQRIALR